MTKVVAGSNLQDIIKLGSFVVASYLGLLIMFAVHGILLGINGVSPLKYFRKVWPVLTFAFTSRSSAASIPLNVEAQTRRLGVPESIASFAASFSCDHWSERLRRFVSGNAGGDGCAYGWH